MKHFSLPVSRLSKSVKPLPKMNIGDLEAAMVRKRKSSKYKNK
jgi:hypothetical protein